MNAPLSYPEARNCWLCNAVKVVLRIIEGHEHRMCPKCDAPDMPGRLATWQEPAA